MTVADALRGARDHWHLRVLKKRLADTTTAPVIITGMHRSGTSLVSRLLRGHGVYLGNVLDANSEAVEFLAMNDQVLLQLGSTWQAPASDMDILDPDTRRRLSRGETVGPLPRSESRHARARCSSNWATSIDQTGPQTHRRLSTAGLDSYEGGRGHQTAGPFEPEHLHRPHRESPEGLWRADPTVRAG